MRVCTGFVVDLYCNWNDRTAFRRKLYVEPSERYRRGTRGGHDAAICGLTEFRFHAVHGRDNAIRGTEMSEQKLTGRCLSERELSARMNCAEMIEIRTA